MSNSDSNFPEEEMLPEYDFSQGVRGKHYRPHREGYQVIIEEADGSKSVESSDLADPLTEEFTLRIDPISLE